MNFFKTCFEPNYHIPSIDSEILEKEQEVHQKLTRESYNQGGLNPQKKQYDGIANRLEVRGAWHHREEQIDYKNVAYKQNKYREFLSERRRNMCKWNECFEEQFK